MQRRHILTVGCFGCAVAYSTKAQLPTLLRLPSTPQIDTGPRIDPRRLQRREYDVNQGFCMVEEGVPAVRQAGSSGLGIRSYTLKGEGRNIRSQITWSFNQQVQNLSNAKGLIARACEIWSGAAPGLTFGMAKVGAPAAIQIAMGKLPGNILGVTAPDGSSITLSNSAAWNEDLFLNVVTHELGHAIGLLHSTDANSIMYPWGDPTNLTLSDDDRSAVRALYGWSDQVRLEGGSEQAPALCWCNGSLVRVWRGARRDNDIWISVLAPGASMWSAQRRIAGAATSGSPSLAWNGSTLFMAWKGVEGDSALYWAASTDFFASTRFGIKRFSDRGSSHGPRIAAQGAGLMMCWKGIQGDSSIYWSSWSGGTSEWSLQKPVRGVGTSASPAICRDLDSAAMRMAWKGVEGDTALYTTTFANGFWQPQQRISWMELANAGEPNNIGYPGSQDGPSLVNLSNKIIAAWRGIPGDQALYFSQLSVDCLGSKRLDCKGGQRIPQWSQQAVIPNTGSSHAPAISEAGTRIFAVWRGIEGDNAIYSSIM